MKFNFFYQCKMAIMVSALPLSCIHKGQAKHDMLLNQHPSACQDSLPMTSPPAGKIMQQSSKISSIEDLSVQDDATSQEFSIEYLMGKFDPATHPDFVQIDKKYAGEEGYYLRKETAESWIRMWEAARKDGIELRIVSATRNFERQKKIWESKWNGTRAIENGANAATSYPDPKQRALKILEYSSMPGTSRHHWGTDIDINDLDNYTFEHGQGKKVYEWLQKNAHKYGFCQPYTPKGKERPHGYNEEKWHWSYIPIARKLTDFAAQRLRDEMITGFQGAENAVEIGVVEKYVLGINKRCL